MGLITNNDKTAYREEVRALMEWCQGNNLNVNRRKELREHASIHIDGTAVEKVEKLEVPRHTHH